MGLKEKDAYLKEIDQGFDGIDKGKKIEKTPIKPPDPPKISPDQPKEIIPPSKGEPGYEEWYKRIMG